MANALDSINRQADLDKIKVVARTSGADLSDDQASDIWNEVSMMQGEEWLCVPQSHWEIWSYISSHVGNILKGHD